jgi:ATP synthase protein I
MGESPRPSDRPGRAGGAGRAGPEPPAVPASPGERIGRDLKAVGGYGTVGLEIVVGMLLGVFGGQWLDARWGTSPAMVIVGMVLGLGAGVRALVRANRSAIREAEEQERLEGNPRPDVPYPPHEGQPDSPPEGER